MNEIKEIIFKFNKEHKIISVIIKSIISIGIVYILERFFSFLKVARMLSFFGLDIYIHNFILSSLIFFTTLLIICLFLGYKHNHRIIKNINISTNKNNRQWTLFREIPISGKTIQKISSNFIYNSEYIRFGFKLGDHNFEILNTQSGFILTNDNSYLIHIGNNDGEKNINIQIYKKGKPCFKKKDVLKNIPALIKFGIMFDKKNKLIIKLNEKTLKTDIYINENLRKKLYYLAWGDDYEYNITLKRINVSLIKTRGGKTDLLYIPDKVLLIANPHPLNKDKVIERLSYSFTFPIELLKKDFSGKIIENIRITIKDDKGEKYFIPHFVFNEEKFLMHRGCIPSEKNINGKFESFEIENEIEKWNFIFIPEYPPPQDYSWKSGENYFEVKIKIKSQDESILFSSFKIILDKNIIQNLDGNNPQEVDVLKI